MSGPQPSSSKPSRAPWLKVTAVVWLALVSAVVIVTQAELSHVVRQNGDAAKDLRVPGIVPRIDDLEGRADAAARQPKPLTPSDLDAVRQVLGSRLSRLEEAQAQAQASAPRSDDILAAVRARVSAVGAQLRTRPPSTSSRQAAVLDKPVAEVKPEKLEPPFRILGPERRGDERFLSIQPQNSNLLSSVQLLGEGEASGPWQLQAIDGRSAGFLVDGQTLRVAIP